MTPKKYLIVNADDFGQSRGVNEGVIKGRESGVVTSASLMVRWPAAGEAAAYSRKDPELSLGLHVDLGEWMYRDGNWVLLYRVVSLDDVRFVREEVTRQLVTFYDLVGTHPTHLDSHQHVHLREPARSVLLEIARDLHVPLRHFTPQVHHCGNFYGQSAEGRPLPELISVEALIKILGGLPKGVSEVSCHPGEGNDLATMYRNERAQELKVLCDRQIRTTIARLGIELCSFASLPDGYWQASAGIV